MPEALTMGLIIYMLKMLIFSNDIGVQRKVNLPHRP